MDKQQNVAIRKRQQINHANRMMFLWVAGVSVIVGISVVLIVFLVQNIIFNERVLAEKGKTVSTLEKNIKVAEDLSDAVRVLNTNENLQKTRANESDAPVQSVLDALPAEPNSTAFASSLQTKLLAGVPGIVVESITVQPVSGFETSSKKRSGSTGKIDFSFSVSADLNNYAALRQVLERIEKSIRPITVTNMTVEAQGTKVVMSVQGVTYYEAAKTLNLTEKVIRP